MMRDFKAAFLHKTVFLHYYKQNKAQPFYVSFTVEHNAITHHIDTSTHFFCVVQLFACFSHSNCLLCISISLAVPPLFVRLQGLNHPLVSGVRTQANCTSAGARPSPQIVWNKGGVLMRGATQTVSALGTAEHSLRSVENRLPMRMQEISQPLCNEC